MIPNVSITSYEAVTKAGIVICTFESRDMALNWWEEHSCEFPGAILQYVARELRERRLTVRSDRLRVVRSA